MIGVIFMSCTNNIKSESEDKSIEFKEEVTTEDVEENSDKTRDVFEADKILVLSELKDGEVYNNMTVADYKYTPNDSFNFTLEGEFEISGDIMIDEMWSELSIQFDEAHNPHKNLIVDNNGYQTKLITFSYFSNPEELKNSLTDEQKSALDNGERVPIKIKVKDFTVGGKLDGYGESYVEFVKIID
jgi:hypothetical protein